MARIESGELKVVGQNCFTEGEPSPLTTGEDGGILTPDPEDVPEDQNFISNLNLNSLEVLPACRVEPGLKDAAAGSLYQFERQGYFCVDPDSAGGKLVFNRSVSLKDTWAKIDAKRAQQAD